LAEAKSKTISEVKFLEAVRKGKRFEVLLLRSQSDEEPLLRFALKSYLKSIITPGMMDFDYSEFRGSEIKADFLWNALTTMPLMSNRRVVLLELTGSLRTKADEPTELEGDSIAEQDKATGKKKNADNSDRAKMLEVLKRFIEKPVPTTELIATHVYEDSRDSSIPNWLEAVTHVKFDELKISEQRLMWAKNYVKRYDKTISDEALQYLIDSSSHGVGDLASKLDNAALYVGEARAINVQILMKVSGVTSEYTVYNLEDAILAQKPQEAHKIARSLLEGGEELLRLLSGHRREILRLWQVKRALRKDEAWQRGEEAQRFYQGLYGKKIFKINEFKRAARAISEERFQEAIVGLLDVEIRAKTSSERPTRYYEWLWMISTNRAFPVGTQLSN
jgi:DNA polymerase III subunit delta